MPVKHRQSKLPEYTVWERMRDRCNNPNHKHYMQYGGRGIAVCSRWDDFAAFMEDMGPRPANMSLDRIDNDHGYSPDNCQWATKAQQVNNTQRSIHIEYLGRTQTLKQWSDELGLRYRTIWFRYSEGVRVPALFSPIGLIKGRSRLARNIDLSPSEELCE